MNENNEKVGMSTLNWILSILGIIVLASFIILPPTFRLFLAKKGPSPDELKPVVIQNLKCEINAREVDTHTEADAIEIVYSNDQIKSYTRKTDLQYTTIEDFDLSIKEFGRLSTAYSLVEGADYSASPDNVNLKITVNKKYDLSIFSEKIVSIPGDEEPVDLKSEYTLDNSVAKIKVDLTEAGYSCVDKVVQ